MKKVLLLIDCQNDFIDGVLGTEDAVKTVDNIVEKIHVFDGDCIMCTLDTHTENYLNTSEGKKLPVVHCIRDTHGWEINGKIKEALNSKSESGVNVLEIPKQTFASVESLDYGAKFNQSNLVCAILSMELGLKEPVPMEIEMCGFCTDICVVSNALVLKAFTHDFAEIIVDANCCAGVTADKHNAALDVMESCQIIVKNRD